jgi:thiosulfate/3-mercaptopyruvate sulfurtransferase
MKKAIVTVFLLAVALATQPAFALFDSYNYISAAKVKEKLGQNAAMTLVDIQVEAEFNQHHIEGAVATHAYPVKSPEDRAKLAEAVTTLKNNENLAVIVCPRGGGGAKRAYDHLLDQGIAAERLVILSDGQAAWPYPELLAPAQ